MKTTLFLIFAFATLVYATKHENIKCWTCGPTQEGPEEKGWCKDQNEQGNLTTCVATEQSCAVGLISEGQETNRYFKKCWPMEYHAKGCFDVVDQGITGTVCVCGEDSCNANFDPLNNMGSTIVVPIITVVVNMVTVFLMK